MLMLVNVLTNEYNEGRKDKNILNITNYLDHHKSNGFRGFHKMNST